MEQQDINTLIEELSLFNMELLANSRIKICNENPTHRYCVVTPNTYEKWISYLKSNRFELFEKGINRLDTWKALLNQPPFIYFKESSSYNRNMPDYNCNIPDNNIISQLIYIKEEDPNKYYFILAAFMIIFQVFGDGNHRTANYFYNKYTGTDISPKKLKAIDNIRRTERYDYYTIKSNPDIMKNVIINQLVEINNLTGGFKKRKPKRSNKTKRRKLNKNRNKNKNTKRR